MSTLAIPTGTCANWNTQKYGTCKRIAVKQTKKIIISK